VRAAQTATDRFDQAVADTLGLNRTDMRCLDILDREGRLSAGQLATQTGLTSGAITTAIDRLEKAGHVRRVRDTDDRRRIYVELTDEARRIAGHFYVEHAALAESLYNYYTEEQIGLLLEFVQRSREFNDRKAAELEAAMRPDDSAQTSRTQRSARSRNPRPGERRSYKRTELDEW
jgi:DNA-binding MarR family transcriptional regulator